MIGNELARLAEINRDGLIDATNMMVHHLQGLGTPTGKNTAFPRASAENDAYDKGWRVADWF